MTFTWVVSTTDGLYHHGIKGQKWGVRRFQKKNGTLTAAGRKRYDSDASNKQSQTEISTKPTKYRRLDRINAYKKEHPNTKLTDQEILLALRKEGREGVKNSKWDS